MTTYNTGNPLGSTDPRDLYDNAENFDEAVNSEESQWVDRFGRPRLPLMEQERQFVSDQERREGEFQADQSSREAVFSDFLQGSGYQDLGEYAPGIEITAHNKYVTFGGQPYLLKPSIPVPYTTSGEWTGDDFKLIGDDSLRQDLANPDKGAAMVARGVVAVDSIADLLALPEGQRKEDLRYLVRGYYAGSDVGGGIFTWDESSSAQQDHGLSFGSGVRGRFLREFDACISPEMFGARGNGIDNDTDAFDRLMIAAKGGNYRSKSVDVRLPRASYLVDRLTLDGYSNHRFEGSGPYSTVFRASSAASGMFVTVNQGSGSLDGDHPTGSVNTNISGFQIDCRNNENITHGMYVDFFRRGSIKDVRIDGARNGFEMNYSWIVVLESITSSQHTGVGISLMSNNLNQITAINLSASSTVGEKNYQIRTNSSTFIGCGSEGSPQEGIVLDNSRKTTWIGTHVEGDSCGFVVKSFTNFVVDNTIEGSIFIPCAKPLNVAAGSQSKVVFRNNYVRVGSSILDLDMRIDGGNVAISENSWVTSDNARIPNSDVIGQINFTQSGRLGPYFESTMDNIYDKTSRRDGEFRGTALSVSEGNNEIPSCAIPKGSSGYISFYARGSSTRILHDRYWFAVNPDGSGLKSSFHGGESGTAQFATELGWNSSNQRITYNAAFSTSNVAIEVEYARPALS